MNKKGNRLVWLILSFVTQSLLNDDMPTSAEPSFPSKGGGRRVLGVY